MNPLSDDLLIELIQTVQEGIARRGFHILSKDELRLLCPSGNNRRSWLRQIEHFATACGACCETDGQMKSARFLSNAAKESQPSLAVVEQVWDNTEPMFEPLPVLAAYA